MHRRTLSLALTSAALAVPATVALAADDGPAVAPGPAPTVLAAPLPGSQHTVAAKLNAAVKPDLVEDVVRLTRKRAALHDRHAPKGLRSRVATYGPARLRAEKRHLRHAIRAFRREQRRKHAAERVAAAAVAAAASASATPAATGAPSSSTATTAPRSAPSTGGGGASSSTLNAIAACESGGNPGAVDSSGTYRGKYQFDMQTWRSVGGSGDPAAASEAEQDARAAQLYSQAGSSPWPVCGR